MNERILLLLCWALAAPAVLLGQRITLEGTLRDAETGEPLIGAQVAAPALQMGDVTNDAGYFKFPLPGPQDTLVLRISSLGYPPTERVLLGVSQDLELNLALKSEATELDEVVVEDTRSVVEETQMSVNRLEMETINRLPAFMGEVDVLKAVQLLPGVKAGTEGTGGFFVRGGSNDQNLVLLDGANVYNPVHMGGLFSVFNPDAVQGLELYKADFPARFGGRLSSVLDVSMRKGDMERYTVNGGLGVISSRLTVEGPIKKNKASFIVSGRRTYFDLFTRAINNAREDDPNYDPLPNYYFYDFNGRIDWNVSDRDRLYFSAYYGYDDVSLNLSGFGFAFDWRNAVGTLGWTRTFGERMSLQQTASFSYYNYRFENQFADISGNLLSQVMDLTYRGQMIFYTSKRHTFRTGVELSYRRFNPSTADAQSNQDEDVQFSFEQFFTGGEGAVFGEGTWDITQRFRVDYGLRMSAWIGEKFYWNPEPRVAARYKLGKKENWAIKASYARMAQYIHLGASSTVTLPTDLWLPTTDTLAPQVSDQVAAGISYTVPAWKMDFTVEGYYKWLYNQVEIAENKSVFLNENPDEAFTTGSGTSYGLEFLARRELGRVTGWVGYTLSWTWRDFADINGGARFPYRFDRRHDLSIVLSYDITKRLRTSATWVFRTGEAISLPSQLFFQRDVEGVNEVGFTFDPNTGNANIQPGAIISIYEGRNQNRTPVYHRMDFSLTYEMKLRRLRYSDITLSIYNVYNRANPFFVFIDQETDDDGNLTGFVPKSQALFPIIPSLTWNFKF